MKTVTIAALLASASMAAPEMASASLCDGSSEEAYFNEQTSCPQAFEAFFRNDISGLSDVEKIDLGLFTPIWITKLHEQATPYLVPFDVYRCLHPGDLALAQRKLVSNEALVRNVVEDAFTNFMIVGKSVLDERKAQSRSGSFDPVREITAFGGGLERTRSRTVGLRWAAEHDAVNWLAIAGETPDLAIQIYENAIDILRREF
ncbi:hypothetical protein RGUI_4337 (plasmid) [Rhodovulum sp. P5]|uniref:hypothetical protein n=1 Tax=Rhodovulum sp. P5 TaxID=1564506 RepID=UPI0009C1F29F|nr:hypothetical protein [Rhodovulum sp. P5]ARE42363.1 hypothetical protein RGUI_4337 [Rhodovulum sp. P5]